MSDTNDETTTQDDTIPEDDVRTVLAYACQNISKQIKVGNDALVSVLNNEVALELKSDEEQELARDAYRDTVSAVESLYELTELLDETSDDEQGVAARFNPAAADESEEEQ